MDLSKIDLNLLDADKAQFVLEKSECVLTALINDRESLQKKAHFILGIIAAGLGYIINTYLDPEMEMSGNLLYSLIIGFTWLSVCAGILIWKCVIPSDYAGLGNEPMNLLDPLNIAQELAYMKVGYVALLQNRISFNRKINIGIAKMIRNITLLIFLTPVASVTILMLIHITGLILSAVCSISNY